MICRLRSTLACRYGFVVFSEDDPAKTLRPSGSFTVDEFARLDLSVMDFTEVYSDFMDAAKLPDEVQTMSDIQDKIQAYYDLHGK